MTDGGQVYHALSVHVSRAKLIVRFNDRYAKTNIKSGVWNKVPERSALIFGDIWIYF